MRRILISFFAMFILSFFVPHVYAVDLSVEAPSEVLVRGQTFDFKISIDTKGKAIAKQSMIFSYDKSLVEFADILEAGDFFDSVGYQTDQVSAGKILIVGESSKAKSGTGLVATVKMRIIATSAGSTQLCAVVPLDVTPTIAPTTPPNKVTPTKIIPTTKPGSTSIPTRRPTTPVTGSVTNMIGGTVIGLMLMMLSITVLMII